MERLKNLVDLSERDSSTEKKSGAKTAPPQEPFHGT